MQRDTVTDRTHVNVSRITDIIISDTSSALQVSDTMKHPAGVLLHVSMQSLRGGNVDAALARLQLCVHLADASLNPGTAAATAQMQPPQSTPSPADGARRKATN